MCLNTYHMPAWQHRTITWTSGASLSIKYVERLDDFMCTYCTYWYMKIGHFTWWSLPRPLCLYTYHCNSSKDRLPVTELTNFQMSGSDLIGHYIFSIRNILRNRIFPKMHASFYLVVSNALLKQLIRVLAPTASNEEITVIWYQRKSPDNDHRLKVNAYAPWYSQMKTNYLSA